MKNKGGIILKKKTLALLMVGIFTLSLGLTGCGSKTSTSDKVKVGWITYW